MATQDPYGLKGGFLDTLAQEVDVDKEIENMKKEADALNRMKPTVSDYGRPTTRGEHLYGPPIRRGEQLAFSHV
jgi:hypothetical protein